MPWVIQGGKPVKIGTTPQEITVTKEFDEILVCPECGKEYKTETGLENHVAAKH